MNAAPRANEQLTILMSSDDMDRAFLVFMLANGARSMGMDVNIFFALWGVNLLRRSPSQPGMVGTGKAAAKGIMEKMMGMMMPRGARKTGISKMNFGGMGAAMMRTIMKKKGINSLTELMNMAVELGVRFTVCTMTLDMMGFSAEDLIALPNLGMGGVTSCLGDALNSRMFLVI
jgi:peroxiredoxin family protein